ncbi:MAG: hypothetical protein KAS62_07370, partial [Candidatus Delongbacteria bacterium]|nr:hypothetical protein [Candidatus Delongbacteria bacterium]
FPAYFDVDSLYEESSLIFNQQEFINALDTGYNVFYHQSHGDYNKIGFPISDPNQNNWGLWSDHFYNFKAISGLYLIVSCHPGDISFSGLSQKAMINPTGGCVNYIGSSSEDLPGASVNMHTVFFNQMFRGKSIGESLLMGKLYGFGSLFGNGFRSYMNYSYNIQGDPSNKLFLREPRNITILGLSQFKKGSGTVSGFFNSVPNDTIFISLVSEGKLISTSSTKAQAFTIDYENLTSDSVYVYYHSQESFLKEYGYLVYDNDSVEVEILNISIDDTNNSEIVEVGDDFSIMFDMNVTLNSSNQDSMLVYISEISDSNLIVLNDSVKIAIADLDVITPYSVFNFEYDPIQRSKADSISRLSIFFETFGGETIYQQDLFIPLADPNLKLQSVSYSENNILPAFINDSKGLINKAEINLLELLKDGAKKVKSSKILYNIEGLSLVKDDTLLFVGDSLKTYYFELTINDDHIYQTSQFVVNHLDPQDITVYADYSPGKVNLNWTHDYTGDFKYNIYIDTQESFLNPILKNFEPILLNEFSFNDDHSSPLFVKISLVDSYNVEFVRSEKIKISFIPLYQDTKFKVSPYQVFNPMYIDDKLISNVLNSSISGINKDGSLINGDGVIHEADVNGFS